MNYRYSDLSVEQLYNLIAELKEKAQKAEQLGNVSEVEINERKIQIAQSYTMNPEAFKPGELYELKTEQGFRFRVEYIQGIFAWGNRMNLLGATAEKTEGIPISLLGNKIEE